MGNLFSADSTPSTARFYEGITLLYANPNKEFPQNFDPSRPFKTELLRRVSRASFVDSVNGRNGPSRVVLLDDKILEDPTKFKLELESPLDCELRNNATYVIVHPTPPIPERYTNITLIWGNPEENFADGFDYKDPFGSTVIDSVSRESFISRVEGEDCVAVLPLDDFLNFSLNPTAFTLKEKTPREVELRDNATFILIHSGEKGLMKRVSDVAAWQRNHTDAEERHMDPADIELRDGATYIVLPRKGKNYEQVVDDVAAWQRNHTDAEERHVRNKLVKMLEEENHTNVEPVCFKRVTGPGGKFKELDAAAVAEGCAMVAEHKHVVGSKAAEQLRKLIAFIKKYRDQDEGNVSIFRGKRLIGVLAGATVTTDTESKDDMDILIQSEGYRVYYMDGLYGDDHCSPSQASCDACDVCDAPSGTPGNGPTAAPSAVPRRGGRPFLAPLRGRAMLVRPRLVNTRTAGFRLTF